MLHAMAALRHARATLESVCASLEGSSVEDNVYSISVHYRNVKARPELLVTPAVPSHRRTAAPSSVCCPLPHRTVALTAD